MKLTSLVQRNIILNFREIGLCGKLYTRTAFLYSMEHLWFKGFLAFCLLLLKYENYVSTHGNFILTLDDSWLAQICSCKKIVLCPEIKPNVFFFLSCYLIWLEFYYLLLLTALGIIGLYRHQSWGCCCQQKNQWEVPSYRLQEWSPPDRVAVENLGSMMIKFSIDLYFCFLSPRLSFFKDCFLCSARKMWEKGISCALVKYIDFICQSCTCLR